LTQESTAISAYTLEGLLARVGSRAFYRAAIAGVIIFYLALAIGRTVTDSPGCDEGWFASPALNLATNSHMGTTVIEESNLGMTTGIHRFTYWIMPLNVLTQAAWYKVFGFGLFSMRSISIISGLLALAAWLSIMQSLSGDRKVTIVALVLIALDFAFIRSASSGRMDMMSAALNFAAFAAYLRLRDRNLTLAILVSQTLVVASGLTHPNGFLGFIGLVFITLYFDRRSLRWRHVLLAVAPYAVGLVAYGLYVGHDPDLFITQLGGNGGGRLWGVTNPWGALKLEIAERYLGLSGAGPNYLKISLIVAYALGIGGAMFTREIRQHKGFRALMIIIILFFTYLTLFEGTKLYLYMVHITPLYAVLLAAWISWCWRTRSAPRWIIAPAFCGLILLHLTGSIYVVLRNSYQNSYLPAISFLNQHSDQNTLIMGTAEMSFGLKFPETLLDDKWLGHNTGRTPDFIVEDTRYEQEQLWAQTRRPEIYEHVRTLLTRQYQQVYNQASYRIYARRQAPL
jgi:4-amino-4-deoxy-L-arabinose transferase-like glycosyltransferase